MENTNVNYVKEFYTLEQVSKELGFNIQTLREYVKNGTLKAYKVGTRYITTRENINNWLKVNN